MQRRHFTIVVAVRRRLPLARRAGLAVAGASSGAEEEMADRACSLRLWWRRHAVEELRDGGVVHEVVGDGRIPRQHPGGGGGVLLLLLLLVVVVLMVVVVAEAEAGVHGRPRR